MILPVSFYNLNMLNVAEITEETTITEQALQTVNTDQKMIGPGVHERIAQALVATRQCQAKNMTEKNLDACLSRLANLYGMDKDEAKILLENLRKKDPQDLKVIYAEIVKDARRKVYTGWTIFSVFNLTLISASIVFDPMFLILTMLSFFILPILYNKSSDAGVFLIQAKKIKNLNEITGADYCPLELIESKNEKDLRENI